MTIRQILKACQGQLAEEGLKGRDGKSLDESVTGVVIDSRLVEPGNVFVALTGERTDGHQYIADVFKKKAAAVICEKLPERAEGLCILVEDGRKALMELARYYRGTLSIPVIGITGSVGKTSTKEFVAGVLAEKFLVHKTKGNFNNEIGVPLTLLSIPGEADAAVVEMGINHFGEMHRLSYMVQPDICILTNIGECHLEALKDRDGVLKAKSEMFDFMNPSGYVIANGDDDKLASLKEVKGRPVIHFGLGPANEIRGEVLEDRGLLGTRIRISMQDQQMEALVSLPGVHMVYNALAAAAAASVLGLSCEEIVRGIQAVQAVGGRSRVVECHDKVVIDDCYNANPVSVKAALDLLAGASARKVAILGDMFELGEQELSYHREIGRYAAQRGVDCLVCAGTLSKEMYEGAMEAGILEAHYFTDRDSLIKELSGLLREHDTILVKASHSMGFEAIARFLGV